MTRYATMLFDLDGTLTDPKVGITKGIQYALSKLGIEEQNLDKLLPFIGPPLHTSFEQFYGFTPAKAMQAVDLYRVYYKEFGIYENVPYAGIDVLLGKLKDDGRRLIVATSKLTAFAQEILRHFRLAQFFDEIVGSNLDGTRSDKADVIAHALRQFADRDKQAIVMVGDRKYDIIGAQKNGIDSVGVLYGYGSLDEINHANPTFMADSVKSLMTLFANGEESVG